MHSQTQTLMDQQVGVEILDATPIQKPDDHVASPSDTRMVVVQPRLVHIIIIISRPVKDLYS